MTPQDSGPVRMGHDDARTAWTWVIRCATTGRTTYLANRGTLTAAVVPLPVGVQIIDRLATLAEAGLVAATQPRTEASTAVRNQMATMVEHTNRGGVVIITEWGRPVAALVPTTMAAALVGDPPPPATSAAAS